MAGWKAELIQRLAVADDTVVNIEWTRTQGFVLDQFVQHRTHQSHSHHVQRLRLIVQQFLGTVIEWFLLFMLPFNIRQYRIFKLNK